MDENPTGPRSTTCTCCGRRDVRRPAEVRVTPAGSPMITAVCPECDLAPAELQGWTTDLLREGR
ncbi:hypothetical protein ACLFMI_20775 [Pseudonocardia nantongensis]|uniref:hypothetical protein n=1 Tax=Pseudonocardia nantongensis TaxID=1181885 RepID=UPI00397E90E8